VFVEARSIDLSNGTFHYYTRAVSDDTSLYLFGCGLGEIAIISQTANAFKKLVQSEGDPELGMIVISVGIGETSKRAWLGDINLHWICSAAFGDSDYVRKYVESPYIKPDIFLCPTRKLERMLTDRGYEVLYLPLAVGDSFHPLNLNREGLGYAGIYRSNPVYRIVLEPYIGNPRFEWVAKRQSSALGLTDLNRWYNSKQIVFGCCTEKCLEWGLITNRVYETLASGTPFVTTTLTASDEVLGFHYPYQSASQRETVDIVECILQDYPPVLKQFSEYSKFVRENHTYINRLRILFKFLEKWR